MAKRHLIEETTSGGNKEIIVKKTYSQKVDGETYYITFIFFMQNFFQIKGIKDVFVLAKLCSLGEYNTGVVKLTKEERGRICRDLSIQNGNLSHSLKRLRELGLINGRGSDIQIDPRVFWKGELDVRRDRIKELNITLSVTGTKEEPKDSLKDVKSDFEDGRDNENS